MLDTSKLTVEEKLTRARIQMYKQSPFFSYILFYMKQKEVTDEAKKKAIPTMGVDVDGNLFWNRDFVTKLSEDELKGVLAHEVLHCLTPDQPVITDKGFKPIQEIKNGDRVWSQYGAFTEVVKSEKFRFKGKTYTIKPRFGLPITFTGEHPILAIKQKDYNRNIGALKSKGINYAAFRYIKAEDLEKNDLVCIVPPKEQYTRKSKKKLFRTRDYYTQKTIYLDKDTAYFLGFFVGDGCLHRVKKQGEWFDIEEGKVERQISLTLAMKDDYNKLMNIIKTKFFRSPHLTKLKDVNARRITFSGKSIAKFLRDEFYNGKEKTIPSWLVNCKKPIIKSFIDGLRDADGHITKKGRIGITNTAVGVYSMLPLLLMKLKIVPAFSHYKRDGFKTPYCVAYNENPKKDTGIFHKDKFIMPIHKIEVKEYKGYVYNIETKAHTFCVPYFTTHNCALMHLERGVGKEHQLFNIANDLVANDILRRSNFSLPSEGMIPDHQSSYKIKTAKTEYELKNINDKSSEEVYDELYPLWPKIKIELQNGNMQGFDKHIYGNGKNKDGEQEGNNRLKIDRQQKWKKIVAEAAQLAKQQGKLPAGMERFIEDILDSKVSWRQKLYKYIVDQIIHDFTWNYPSKRTISIGVYTPRPLKESVHIVVSIDTSGSIGQEELQQFLSELLSIGNSFPNIKLDIIICDAEVHETYELTRDNVDDIMRLKMSGGGGTSHKPIYKYVVDNIHDAKVLINFTDGYTDFPKDHNEFPFDSLWVLDKNGCDPKNIPFGEVIKLDR